MNALRFPSVCLRGRDGPFIAFLSILHRPTIAKVRGPSAANWVSRNVTVVEGFYYGETIPMIVDDIKRIYINTPFPPDAYLPIVGPIPSWLKNGNRVIVTLSDFPRGAARSAEPIQRENDHPDS